MQAILALSNLNAYFIVRCKIERRVYDDVTVIILSDLLHFVAVIILSDLLHFVHHHYSSVLNKQINMQALLGITFGEKLQPAPSY